MEVGEAGGGTKTSREREQQAGKAKNTPPPPPSPPLTRAVPVGRDEQVVVHEPNAHRAVPQPQPSRLCRRTEDLPLGPAVVEVAQHGGQHRALGDARHLRRSLHGSAWPGEGGRWVGEKGM